MKKPRRNAGAKFREVTSRYQQHDYYISHEQRKDNIYEQKSYFCAISLGPSIRYGLAPF